VKVIQVTIDGKEESHNKRRILKNGNPTYQAICNNIESLVNLKPNIHLIIRVNVDHLNKSEFVDVYNYFTKKYSNQKVSVYPGFVTDYSGGCNSDCIADVTEKSKYLIDLMNEYNIYSNQFYPQYNKQSCIARQINSFLIGPDGGIYKCWNLLGDNTQKIGNVNMLEDEFNSLLAAKYLLYEDYLDDEECKDCALFRACSGGCPLLRIKKRDEDIHIDYCHVAKGNIEGFLEMHYQRLNRENKN
jgi:uncharacterized protein